MATGRIVKAVSGFYYVDSEEGYFQCRGRGLFRKQKIKPLVGDFVRFEAENHTDGYVLEIKERSNELVRPPVANIDQALLIFSAVEPDFSTWLLDRFLVHVENEEIQPVILVSKWDKADEAKKEMLRAIQKDYEHIGYPFHFYSTKTGEGIEEAAGYFPENYSLLSGQSGVGKSSLLNAVAPDLDLETANISGALGRGKHTTRHVEFLRVNNGWVADTPGFSSLDFGSITAEDLDICFPEMRARMPDCKFRGCSHRQEPGCAIRLDVEEGRIPSYRYEHYKQFHEEISSTPRRY